MDFDTAWARRYPARLARAALLDGVTRPLVHALASPTVEGLDRLDAMAGPAIFAANHASHDDTPLVLTALPERFRHRVAVAAAADYFFDKRWKGALHALSINAIPMERRRASPQSNRLTSELLAGGWSLIIFPEGGRSPDGWARAHEAGTAYLSVRTGVPVVPIHIEGTRRVLKKGGRGLRPSTTTITFGSPLRPDPAEGTRAFAARIERQIAVLADEARCGFWEARRRSAAGTTPVLTGPPAVAWRRSWELGEGRRRRTTTDRWPPA
ncbi:MAG: lysophospholipid acyltransferase family protein [Acidimicrobiales bacterium]